MEPVTHFLTGACIGRAGLNRKSKYATLVAVLAAEAADLDVFWGLRGPVEELKHHRGITHTFIGVPVVAGVVVGAVWLLDWWLQRRRAKKTQVSAQNLKAPTAPPLQKVHWGWLYLTALIAALSHLLLDWTNNYGLRPFYPFNPRWYAGNLVFIVEPVLLALLLAAMIMPWLLGFTDAEIGARRKPFRGQGWAIFALVGMIAYWGWRWEEQTEARELLDQAQVTSAPVTREALEPYPVNPFHWYAILETADYYQTAEIHTRTGEVASDPHRLLYKPTPTAATEAAKRTQLGQVFLDWGAWAVVRDLGPVPIPGMAPPQVAAGQKWTTVEFDDLRFHNPLLDAGRKPRRATLGGAVYIVDGRDDAGESMRGHRDR